MREDKRKRTSPNEENLQGIDKLKVVRSALLAITHVDYSARLQVIMLLLLGALIILTEGSAVAPFIYTLF